MSESIPPNESASPASNGASAQAPATPQPGQIPVGDAIPKDDKTIAILTHLSGVIHLILMPLIVWILKKDSSPYLNDQAKEALNFHISLFIYHIVAAVLSIFLCGVPSIGVWIFSVVAVIIAAVAASKGEYFRYPMCLRLVK